MTGVDRIELALIRKIGDFRNDPARRRTFDRACNEAKAKFMMEQDGSPEMTDWIAARIANLEREHGPQLDIDARHRLSGQEQHARLRRRSRLSRADR
jgi:hypothetical protein